MRLKSIVNHFQSSRPITCTTSILSYSQSRSWEKTMGLPAFAFIFTWCEEHNEGQKKTWFDVGPSNVFACNNWLSLPVITICLRTKREICLCSALWFLYNYVLSFRRGNTQHSFLFIHQRSFFVQTWEWFYLLNEISQTTNCLQSKYTTQNQHVVHGTTIIREIDENDL